MELLCPVGSRPSLASGKAEPKPAPYGRISRQRSGIGRLPRREGGGGRPDGKGGERIPVLPRAAD